MDIEIKPGQVWETRSGKRVKIDEVLADNDKTPVRSGGQYWALNGRYWSDTNEHSRDLIKLING